MRVSYTRIVIGCLLLVVSSSFLKANNDRRGHLRALLSEAVVTGNLKQLGELLQNGADPNAPSSQLPGQSLLYDAIVTRNYDVVKLLLNYEANPNGILPIGLMITPLELAITTGQPAVVELLLSHGADPNAMAITGQPRSSFDSAVATNQPRIAILLLNYGAAPLIYLTNVNLLVQQNILSLLEITALYQSFDLWSNRIRGIFSSKGPQLDVNVWINLLGIVAGQGLAAHVDLLVSYLYAVTSGLVDADRIILGNNLLHIIRIITIILKRQPVVNYSILSPEQIARYHVILDRLRATLDEVNAQTALLFGDGSVYTPEAQPGQSSDWSYQQSGPS